ncbi:hypothetical protein [Streptomyces sp. 3N207]|uniref:hypothetical protein n=1 Tax=Streptomyces sp. 3N207 TaxID=3457417 RepID=UPI003FD390FB
MRALAEEWLFPAPGQNRTRRGHMSAHHFSAKIFRTWVDSIPVLFGEGLDDQGNPVPYNRAEIVLYRLRHAYTPRHADAGVPVDHLRELMDHREADTTMGYYNPRELHQTGEKSQVTWSRRESKGVRGAYELAF